MSFAIFLFYLVCVYFRPVETLFPELAPYRPMLLLGILALVTALWTYSKTKESAGLPLHYKLIGLLLFAIALSKTAANGVGSAASSLIEFSAAVLLMVLALLNVTTLARLKATCLVVATCVTILAAAGVVAYHTGYMAADLVLQQSTGLDYGQADDYVDAPADDTSGKYMWRVRSLGFLNDPNDFAQTMVMVLPILAGLTMRRRWLRNLVMFVAPAGLLLYCIFLTHSRGAILGVMVQLLFGLRGMLSPIKAGILTATVVAAVAATSFGGGRDFSTKEESAADRIEAWSAGISMLKTRPIYGVGYANFEEYHQLTAHNSFVLCFAELGMLGLFAWLSLIVVAFQGLAQGTLTLVGDEERKMAMLLRASLVGFIACAWFLSRTYAPGLYLLLALCMCARHCCSTAQTRILGLDPLPVRPWVRTTMLASAGAVIGAWAFVFSSNLG